MCNHKYAKIELRKHTFSQSTQIYEFTQLLRYTLVLLQKLNIYAMLMQGTALFQNGVHI